MAKKRNKFSVIEYSSRFAVQNNQTGKIAFMGDGVDSLFTRTGKPMRPGSEHFRKTWERALNSTPDETTEAYFPVNK